MPSPPSPGHRRPSPLRRGSLPLFAALIALFGLLAGSGANAPAARAADDPNHLLDTPMADAAWVDRGPSGPPDLLTIAMDDTQFATATLTLLRRVETWAIQSQTQLQFGSGFDGNLPWFLRLGPGRFVIVTTASNATGVLTTITVDEASLGAIQVDRQVETPIAVSAAGVTDVDGDGTPELVIGGTVGGYDRQCQTAALAVLATDERLSLRRQANLKTAAGAEVAYFTGSSLGQWDQRPGTDLLMQAFECGAESGVGDRHHLLAVHLADLSTIRDVPTSEADMNVASPLPNPPAVIDVDRNGRNEAVVATSVEMRVVDPSDGWRITPFSIDTTALAGTVERSDRGLGTSLVEVRSTGDPVTSGVAVTRLTRVDGRVRVDEGLVRPVGWMSREALDASVAFLRGGAWSEQSPVMIDDLDGDGCADLVAPSIFIGCAGTGVLEPAPALIATRPIAMLGQGADRRLLVADGLDWYPFSGGTLAPSPLATRSDAAWRSSSSNRFVLAELPVATRAREPTFPMPAVAVPAIERAESRDGTVDVRRGAGTRLLARVIGSGQVSLSANAALVTTPTGFLHSDPIDNEWAGLAASLTTDPGLKGFGSVADVERLQLATNVTNQDGTIADHWLVTVAALDASGSLSAPVQAEAVLDQVAPPVKIEAPTLSLPWPFTATLHGTSEAGTSVSLSTGGGGSQVVVAADGTYALPVQLAPWPQDVAVVAVDPAGNQSRATRSVMGGVDFRGLPWPAIGVVVVLVGVFLSSIRGARGGTSRQPKSISVGGDDENATVIEELSMGRIERRD